MSAKQFTPVALGLALLTSTFCFGISTPAFAASQLGATGSPSPQTSSQSTEGWYQVELIVFSNRQNTANSDEIWPLTQLQYPANMVSIAPRNDNELQPYSLGQMQDNERYLALWDGTADYSTQEETDFLFESRGQLRLPEPNFTSKNETDNTNSSIGIENSGVQMDAQSDLQGSTSIQTSAADNANTDDLIDFESLFAGNAVTAFKELPEQDRILNTIARSIRRSSMYNMLIHKSWLQPIVSDSEALPVLIQGGEHYDDSYEIDGTVSISRSRFLHIDTDLWFTQFTTADNRQSIASSNVLSDPSSDRYNSKQLGGELTLTPDQRRRYPKVADWLANQNRYLPVHSHQLRQSRRMRSSTMHFIDHPQFGILVSIQRYEEQTGD